MGNMGLPMARNLLNSGSSIVVYDKMPEPVEAIVKEGATAVGSPQEVAQAAQCIVTMVPERYVYMHPIKKIFKILVRFGKM